MSEILKKRANKSKYVVLIIVVGLIFMLMKSCEQLKHYKGNNKKLSNIIHLDSLKFYSYRTNSGIIQTRQKQVIVERDKEVEKLLSEVEGLRKLSSQIKITTVTKIKEIPVQSIGKTIIISDCDSTSNFLKLPVQYGISNKWYSAYYSIDSEGASQIDSIMFISNPKISVGFEDKGLIKNLFTKDIPIVVVEPGNPYTQVTSMTNITITNRKKFYEKKGFLFVTGAVLGGYITYKLKR